MFVIGLEFESDVRYCFREKYWASAELEMREEER